MTRGESLENDPGATVATAAVQSPSAPSQAQWRRSAWPEVALPEQDSDLARSDASTGELAAHGFAQGVVADSSQSPQGFAPAMPRTERQTSIPAYHPDSDELPGGIYIDADDLIDGFDARFQAEAAVEVPDEVDGEWAMADQPTANLAREALAAATSFTSGVGAEEEHVSEPHVPAPDVLGGPRYASPDGDLLPMTPLVGIPRSAFANPRLERFQELREQRRAHERGERAPQDPSPVTDRVRSWWMDLTPGLQRALKLQHEARESGAHAVPGYVVTLATAVTRMTDAFGRFAESTRDFANRAHATAGPTLRRMHDSAEAAAQALIDKLEGTPVQQQASFLGPGRLAVLFKSGVTVGQAQRLLQGVNARPLRLIPRKHGFLALVTRGSEAQVAARLRQHPWVRDVIYMEYDDPSQSLSTEVPAILGMHRA
jgi:hypothetical protein